jgi:hypothetical protein
METLLPVHTTWTMPPADWTEGAIVWYDACRYRLLIAHQYADGTITFMLLPVATDPSVSREPLP